MRRASVDSTTMRSVGYRRPTLEIEFASGDVYRYFGVPPSVHDELMRAESHGRFFNANIRDRFRYERM